MPSLLDRLLNVAVAEDEAANALVGGKPRETISATIGRARQAGAWWAPAAAAVVDGLFGAGHCARMAAVEQARRDAEVGR